MTDVYVAVLGVFLFASPVVLFTVWVVIANRSLDHIESFFQTVRWWWRIEGFFLKPEFWGELCE